LTLGCSSSVKKPNDGGKRVRGTVKPGNTRAWSRKGGYFPSNPLKKKKEGSDEEIREGALEIRLPEEGTR